MPTTKKTISNTKNAAPKSAAQTVLGRPIITEKAANMGQYNTYTFSVAVGTTKSEIAKAFFAVYKQKAQHVRTINQSAKSYYRRGVLGFGKRSKKAYISIPKGTTIDIV